MIDVERVLSLVLRNRIRGAFAALDQGQVSSTQVQIEMDETLPAISADRTISVIPAGVDAGPYNLGLHDLQPRMKVFCCWRIRKIPRDRKRDIYLANYTGLSAMLQTVYSAIHNVYLTADIDEVATELGVQDMIKGCRMVEPFRFTNLESQTKLVYPADFGSNESQPAGMGRSITFGRARYLAN
jgi:hypothetical protein